MIKPPTKHRGIKWSSKDINILKSLYGKGTNIPDISKATGRTIDAVQHKIKDLGLTDRCLRWTEHEIAQIIKHKEEGKSFREIADIMSRTERSVQSKLLRVKNPQYINVKTIKIPKNNRRVYSVNDSYFSKIDSQKKSYWIGWLMSDGYIIDKINASKGKYTLNRFGMKLAEKDKCVLEDMKIDMSACAPLKYQGPRKSIYKGIEISGTGTYALDITSEQIVKDLAVYGVVPRKTYICEFPRALESKYYPGFISGMMSGDGSVGTRTCHGRKALFLRSSFAGNKDLMEKIRKILIDNVEFNPDKNIRKQTQSKNLYLLELNKGETLSLYYWLKENGTALMPRKNKIIEDYIRDYPEKCNLKRVV